MASILRPSDVGPLAPSPGGDSRAGKEGADEGQMEGLYIISVAARLLNVHPQTLRKYERLGLVSPSRTDGMLRLYSRADLSRIRIIRYLEENMGLNLAGVYMVLHLLGRLTSLWARLGVECEFDDFRNTVEQELSRVFNMLGLSPEGEDD